MVVPPIVEFPPSAGLAKARSAAEWLLALPHTPSPDLLALSCLYLGCFASAIPACGPGYHSGALPLRISLRFAFLSDIVFMKRFIRILYILLNSLVNIFIFFYCDIPYTTLSPVPFGTGRPYYIK